MDSNFRNDLEETELDIDENLRLENLIDDVIEEIPADNDADMIEIESPFTKKGKH